MKNTYRISVITSIAIVCLIALTLPAYAEGNNLEVKCLDPMGNPVSGIKVQLQHINSMKWKDKKSDSKGVALFNKLDDGVYRVVARQQGFAPAFWEFLLLKNAALRSVTLRFETGDWQTKVYFEDQALHQKSFELLNQAIQLLQAGKVADAEKPLQESLKIYPSNPDSYYNLAVVYLQQRKFDAGQEALKRCVDLSMALKELPLPPGQSGVNPLEERARQAQFVLDKMPIFKLRSDAEQAASERRFDEAIAKYQEAIKLDPNEADLYYGLGLAQANARQYDEAAKSADKALQMKPSERDFLELKKRIGEFQENERLLKARAILEEGDKLYQNEDFAGALKKYEQALPMVPQKTQPGILAQMGRTNDKLGQSEPALRAFKQAVEMAPDAADYRKALAQHYLNEKQYGEALNVYADPRATGTTPPDQALFTLGQTLSNQGNSEVAELAFEKALSINPNHAEAYYELGMLLYGDGKNDKRAKELLTKYLQIGQQPDHMSNVNAVLVVIKRRSP